MDYFFGKRVSECTDVLQRVILPAKEIAYHKQKNAENPSSCTLPRSIVSRSIVHCAALVITSIDEQGKGYLMR